MITTYQIVGDDKDMHLTFILLSIATLLFINGKIRSDLIAVGLLITLTLLGIITPAEALAGFSNSVVIMIAGLFIIGAGIFNTGLANKIGNRLIALGQGSETKLLIIIMLTVGVFSAFMSNTGTVAVLMPVVISIAISMKISPTKLLIPLAFASSLGGVLTLIGTPPNLVASNLLTEHGFEAISFFQFTPIGLVALITGIIFMLTVGKRLLPKHDLSAIDQPAADPNTLAGTYKIYPFLHMVQVGGNSPLIGMKLADLRLTDRYNVTVISIERKHDHSIRPFHSIEHIVPKASTILSEKDTLLIMAKLDNKEDFFNNFNLIEINAKNERNSRKFLLSDQYGITEMIVPPQSRFEHKTIRELHFRKKYGLSVLSIYRNGKYIQTDYGKIKLRGGDALLVHGKWDKIEAFRKASQDLIVVGQFSDVVATEVARGKAPIAASIMLFMLMLMTLELIEPVITVLIAAFLMIVTGCVRSIEDGYRKINWESVVLIAAMLPVATALENTGGVKFISELVINTLGSYGPYAILAGFYFLTMLLSQFISNTATAVVFAPVAITTAIEIGASPYPFVITIAVAASMAFATPVASPTNALVMNAGGYQFKDYVKIGVPLQIVLAIVLLIFIPIFYPIH